MSHPNLQSQLLALALSCLAWNPAAAQVGTEQPPVDAPAPASAGAPAPASAGAAATVADDSPADAPAQPGTAAVQPSGETSPAATETPQLAPAPSPAEAPQTAEDMLVPAATQTPAPELTEEPPAGSQQAAVEPDGSAEESSSPQRAVVLSLRLGMGIGSYGYQRPTGATVERLDTVTFAATEVELRALAFPEDRLQLEFKVRYETSLGLKVLENPEFALPNQLPVRVQRVEAGVAPIWRFADSPRAVALAFPIDFTFRTFWPDLRESVKGYFLGGPQVRTELLLPLGDVVSLRAGPELQWIIFTHDALTDGGAKRMGVGVGLDATLRFQAMEHLGLEINYRQTSGFLNNEADGGAMFKDVERYATLRLLGVL